MELKIVANELIRLAEKSANEAGEYMTNLKLQKLLYYEQGFHLAQFGTPLFAEEVLAWMYGPAVREAFEVYDMYDRNGFGSDPTIPKPVFESEEEGDLFYEVYEAYSQYSAIGLMNLSQEESPWLMAGTGKTSVISKDSMREFFKTKLDDEDEIAELRKDLNNLKCRVEALENNS